MNEFIQSIPGETYTMAGVIVAAVIAAVCFVLLVALLRAFIKVCPPNRVMIIEGMSTTVDGRRYGFRVIRGGYAIVVPYFTRARFLDLSVIPINVRVENCNAANGIVVGADATACVGVDLNNDTMLYIGVEKLIGKSRDEIHDQIRDTLVGNFRGAMGRSTPLEAMGMDEALDADHGDAAELDSQEGKSDRARFRRDMLASMDEDLSNFGIRVFSVSIMRIWDQSEYISNLASRAVSAKRQDVEIAEAQFEASAVNSESDAVRRQEIARNQADEAIAAANESLGVARAEYDATVARTKQESQASVKSATNKARVKVEQANQRLQYLKNQTGKTIKAECERQAAELRAEGQSKADSTYHEARNEILQRVTSILADHETAILPMFLNKQIPAIYDAYIESAKEIHLDRITLLGGDGEDTGINAAVNRGPVAMADFIRHFENLYGVRVQGIFGAEESKLSTESKLGA